MQSKTFVEGVIAWIGSVSSVALHTIVFMAFFLFSILGFMSWSAMLLILTTVVSLEAIYLAIFIQMTVNRHAQELADVGKDIDEIQKDVDEIQEDVEEISEDVDESEETDKKRLNKLEQLTLDVQRVLADLDQLKKEK